MSDMHHAPVSPRRDAMRGLKTHDKMRDVAKAAGAGDLADAAMALLGIGERLVGFGQAARDQ